MSRAILVVLCFVITACVNVAPVVNPNNEISIYGVSTLPPQNGEWVVVTASGYQIALAKKGSNKNESFVVNVSIFQLPELSSDDEFLDNIIKSRASGPDIGRFEIQKNIEELSSLNGATCVSYHSISKDKNAQLQGGNTAVMFLENRGYNCKHPNDSKVGVNIEYSLRHFSETNYPSLEKNSNDFFSNIKFTEF